MVLILFQLFKEASKNVWDRRRGLQLLPEDEVVGFFGGGGAD